MKKRWTLWIAARHRPRSIIPGNPDLKIYTSVITPAGLHTWGEVAGPLPDVYLTGEAGGASRSVAVAAGDQTAVAGDIEDHFFDADTRTPRRRCRTG